MMPRKYNVKRLIAVVKIATRYMPDPRAMPMPATTQIVAAVVSPRTNPCECSTAPAPRKPMPEMICAAMRVGSPPSIWATFVEMLMNNVQPTQIRMFVRSPAGLSRISRSIPMMPPRIAASTSFSAIDGSISFDDQRRRGEYERGQESAFRTVAATQNSFAAGNACRPERSEVNARERKPENEPESCVPSDMDSIRHPYGPRADIGQRKKNTSGDSIYCAKYRRIRIAQV